MSELPRLIWTSDPDPIDVGEVTVEIKLRREMAAILLREATKRNLRPIDVLCDIVDSALLVCALPATSEFDEQADALMDLD